MQVISHPPALWKASHLPTHIRPERMYIAGRPLSLCHCYGLVAKNSLGPQQQGGIWQQSSQLVSPGHLCTWVCGLRWLLPLEGFFLLFLALLHRMFHFLTQTGCLWGLILGAMSWQGSWADICCLGFSSVITLTWPAHWSFVSMAHQ